MKNIQLSIVIPVYNAEKYLERCVNSIIALNNDKIEIILVNDGSRDNSFNICLELEKKYRNIRVFSQENGGVGAARNLGINKCKGEYITFIDADDWILKEYSRLIDLVNEELYDVYFLDFIYKYDNKSVISKREKLDKKYNSRENICNEIINGYNSSACGIIYKRKILCSNHIYFQTNMRVSEDDAFNIEYIEHCQNGFYFSEAVYVYDKRNTTSAVHKHERDDLKDYIFAYQKAFELCTKSEGIFFEKDTRYLLKKIFILLALENYDEKILEEFEKSQLMYAISKKRYRKCKDIIMKILLKYKFYRNVLLKKIVCIDLNIIRIMKKGTE